MTQTNNRILDELAKLMTDAAGAAQGLQREVETMMRTQGEKILRDMDVVQREEFEAVKEMAEKARDENERASRATGRARGEVGCCCPLTVSAPRPAITGIDQYSLSTSSSAALSPNLP